MMLKLNDGRSELWQWDTGRKLTVDAECSQVHFSNKVFGRSIDVDVVDGVAIIPDILLQTDKELTAWLFVGTAENGYTKISKDFKVNRRNKPADYVFTPTEQTTLSDLVERLDKIEESQDPDAIKNAVDDYLQNNPIQIDEKDPTVPEWAKQPEKPKYTAAEVGALPSTTNIPSKTSDLTNDSGFVNNAVTDLVNYYLKSETYSRDEVNQLISTIPKFSIKTVSQLPTTGISETTIYLVQGGDGDDLYTEYICVSGKWEILGYQKMDLTGYATETYVKDYAQPKGNYLTEVPEGYATEEFVKNKIAEAELGGTEIPSFPVQSVNGKTGDVLLTAADVGALPDTYTPPNQTAEQVGADPVGTAAVAVSSHNTDEDAHNDIRLELKAISERLTAFFDSDDQTLDELSEIVSYITNNKTLIESITTIKVSVADIVNNLTSNVSNKPLSAAQGVVLKGLIDTVSNSLANYQPKGNYALRDELPTVPTKVSAFENDKGYLTQHQDISHKLDANKLPEAVNTALAQAKESGEFDGADGKSAYQYAKGGGYTGTEEEFAEKLAQEPLVGTTEEITPSQVAEAIEAGRDVSVTYNDATYGTVVFSSFMKSHGFNAVASSEILQYDGAYILVELYGNTERNQWALLTNQIAQYSDIPTVPSSLKNPYALTINGKSYDGSAAVNMTIEGGSGDSIPSYVKTEAERVAKVVQSRQNASTLTFITGSDAHLPIPSHSQYQNINNGLIHAGQAMGLLKKQIYTDFSFYAGDMIWDVGETAETAMASMRYVHEVLADGFSGVQFWCRGNHEYGYESGANLTEEQIFANVGKWNTGAVFNPEDRAGGYCYRDIDDYKVRVICINTGDGITNISAKQNAWLAEALNVPADDGWGTILLSHCPPDWLNGSATESSLLMQTIKAASGIICCIHGHTHCYKIGTVTGTNIPRIAVPNICFTRNNEYGSSVSAFGETSTVNKTANSANDTAFAVISIDRASGTAYVDYFGARPEDSRTVSGLPTWKTKKIVNQVSISQKKDSNDVYNGTGYKNGAYPSDAGADGTDSATVVTGWIPYNKEVIYVKGATLDTTNSHVRWRSYHANKSDGMYSAGSTIGDYFTIETLGDKYYKLTPKDTITIYDYYRMSFVGTGENLIISHNEPIE